MHVLRDNGEDGDWGYMANYYSLWVSLCWLYFLCLSHAVSLQITSLAEACYAYDCL